MPNKIGRFEIISQAAQTPFSIVYKALDPENQQTIALKVVALSTVLDRDALVKAVFEEAERSKPLNSHNIATLYGVGDEDGQLLAASEYVQGNSLATTLARGDGFSIWDIQDVARQVCHALDHAQVHKIVHHSLEPAKIMVQWDGMVKVLGFGISNMNSLAGTSPHVPEVLRYISPEQLRGEACDHRSAIFAFGAVLYEMATEQKAFTGDSPDQLRASILDSTPAPPKTLKGNLSPGLNDVILKALSKSPDDRYQSGQELVRDLEQCNAAVKPATTVASQKPKARTAGAAPASSNAKSSPFAKATAAASASAAPARLASAAPAVSASAAASPEPAVEEAPASPSFAVDPLMAEGESGAAATPARKSFSELDELPPLKDIFVPSISPSEPAANQPAPEVIAVQQAAAAKKVPEKPKVQVREAAQKAVTEIRNTPRQLYFYGIGAAVVAIVLIVAGLALHNFFADHESDDSATTSGSSQPASPKRQLAKPAPQPQPAPAPAPQQTVITPPPPADTQPAPVVTEEPEKPRNSRRSRARVAEAPQVAQLTVSSNPTGAQITFDGSPLCQSPCTLTDIAPGQHTISASKAGFEPASRAISLKAGANLSTSLSLNALSAMLSVSSTPSGAEIFIDGEDTGKLTPMQFSVTKPGAHTVVVRRVGYLEASNSVNAQMGQSAAVNLTLTKLGETDDIRSAGGKFKKLLNRGESASMGTVSIKTQPKGAQIMVNNRVLDKTSPFDFYLNPGTYVIDVTMSGYRGVHRVINVEEGEKVSIEETLLPQ
jgi:serine/threonine protein kinase